MNKITVTLEVKNNKNKISKLTFEYLINTEADAKELVKTKLLDALAHATVTKKSLSL